MHISRLFAAALLAGALLSSCRTVRVPEYTALENISQKTGKPVRIVQISDFHSNDFGKSESTLIKKIKDAHPDVIVLTGDIFDFKMSGSKPVENVRLLLQGIQGLCPFYYVTGNHEYFDGHNAEYCGLITEYGGIVLEDTAVKLALPQGTIIIAGVFDPFAGSSIQERKQGKENKNLYRMRLSKAAQAADSLRASCTADGTNVLFTVLLAHRPEYIDDYLNYDFDIILAGHAHGGQWRIPGLLNGIYAPMQGLFPKYAGGRYSFKSGTVFIVSRGLSYQRPWFPRIFDSPELVIIDAGGTQNITLPKQKDR